MPDVRAIDVAPTVAFLLGIPGPQNARGQILYSTSCAGGDRLREVTILDISDFHGQLVPLSASTDDFEDEEGADAPSFGVGGAAFLKPWFDAYRADASGLVLTITAGDAVGATPPISSFFEDMPTIEIDERDGLQRRRARQPQLRPRLRTPDRRRSSRWRQFPYLSVNLVDEAGNTPGAWSPSLDLRRSTAPQIALIGFSNTDIPNLTFPGALGPYQVIDPIAPINDEAARLRGEGVDAVVAIGPLRARPAAT